MNPLVSVIIPVHNGAKFLADALQSVEAQKYTPLEVFVADDASTDDSAAIAASFPGVTCLRLPKVGVSRARNLAIEQSSGKWLAFLDADDRWLPGKLAAQVDAGEAEGMDEFGFLLCRQLHRFESGIPEWFRGPRDGSSTVGFEPSTWLVRREVFDRVGGFEETRTLGEDTDWLARAWDLGVKHLVVDQDFVERRIHGENATGLIPNQRAAIFAVLRESVARKRKRGPADEA